MIDISKIDEIRAFIAGYDQGANNRPYDPGTQAIGAQRQAYISGWYKGKASARPNS